MKNETASQLLSISIKNQDLDAMYMACSNAPWEAGPLGFDPLSDIANSLRKAHFSVSGNVGQARVSWGFFLQGLAQSSYSSGMNERMSGLVDLGNADLPSLVFFAKNALEYAKQRKQPCWLLHELLESPDARSLWIIPMVEAGFDPHQERPPGDTPLHGLVKMASTNSNRGVALDRLRALERLIDQGWDLTRKSSLGCCPAELAETVVWHALSAEDKDRYAPVFEHLRAQAMSICVDPARCDAQKRMGL